MILIEIMQYAKKFKTNLFIYLSQELSPVRCCRSRTSSDFSGHLSRRCTSTSRSRETPEQTVKSRNLPKQKSVGSLFMKHVFVYCKYISFITIMVMVNLQLLWTKIIPIADPNPVSD